ncbi:MAG: chromate transporter [Pseudolabrys sp.]
MAGIQHQVVDVHHWVTAREFVDLFALSRASPGPGTMLATLIGWHVWGWTGALLATLGLFLPSSLLCYSVVRVWNRHRGKEWHTALERGLGPGRQRAHACRRRGDFGNRQRRPVDMGDRARLGGAVNLAAEIAPDAAFCPRGFDI